MLDLAAVVQVIVSVKTCRERSKNRTVIQPGIRESVSMIETISADGSLLSAFLIWKAQYH